MGSGLGCPPQAVSSRGASFVASDVRIEGGFVHYWSRVTRAFVVVPAESVPRADWHGFSEHERTAIQLAAGERLRWRRLALGLTEAQLARLVGLGVEEIVRWERGLDLPTDMEKLAIESALRGRLG